MTSVAQRAGATNVLICAALLVCAGVRADETRDYHIDFEIELAAGKPEVRARIRLGEGASALREMRFRFDPHRMRDFRGDGRIEVDEKQHRVTWTPPKKGGALEYLAIVTHTRAEGRYDALVTKQWALFRGGDVFPPATTRTVKDARSVASLVIHAPPGWSTVTPYLSDGEKRFRVRNRARRFDRPTGWIVTGKLGVRRAKIGDTRIAVASPTGQGVRRMDIMAFLRWTLPSLRNVFPTLDSRVVIVGAGDPMWRGGLSGPGSLFLHADRPLISENGTSTLLHELVHVAMAVSGDGHDDWVVEGLAEYYSLRILRDTGTLGPHRLDVTLEALTEWGADAETLFTASATGPVKARAAVLFARVDEALVETSGGRKGLDQVVAAMLEEGEAYSYESLCRAVRIVAGDALPLLHPDKVPGAPRIESCI